MSYADIPSFKKIDYIQSVKPDFQEFVANQIYEGEKLQEALNSPEGQGLIEVIGNIYRSKFNELMNLVVEKKYERDEEIWRVREICVYLDCANDILKLWKGKLDKLNKHVEKISKL
jgi:predicted translin family RNA/ssDNA-binding protein